VGARAADLSAGDAAAAAEALGGGATVGAGAAVALQVLGADVGEKAAAAAAHARDALRLPLSALAAAPAAGAARLSALFFGPAVGRLASARAFAAGADFSRSACALVLPHVLLAGAAGAVLADLAAAVRASSGAVGALDFGCVRVLDLSRAQAEEFLEVYKNVVPEYVVRGGGGGGRARGVRETARPRAHRPRPPPPPQDLVNEYSSGPLLALEVRGEDAVLRLRAIAGPRDVDVAQRIRPESLRAKHGTPASAGGPGCRAKLAVHATELPEDGPLECETLFSLVDTA